MNETQNPIEHNKAVVRRYLEEVYGGGRLELVDELFDPAYVAHDAPPGLQPGPAGVKRALTAFRTAFPDLTLSLTFMVAEGDLVAARFVTGGTHRGELLGVAPTGHPVAISATYTARLSRGRIVESWVNGDDLGMWRQLGVLHPPGS